MRIILGLLLFTTLCAAEPAKQDENKPANIRDGQAAESYINKALYEFLEKPPYFAIAAETPFILEKVEGKNVWVSLVDFYCGLNEEERVHGETVIIYDSDAKQPRFMNPDDLKASSDGVAI